MITVCILSKNSSETMAETLASVRTFSEVIVLDNGSTDETIQIAKTFPNVRVSETVFSGFGALRNEAAALASNDWILALDTDECLSPELLAEIRSLNLSPKTVYSMPRKNYYNGKHIKGCGWHPDRVLRLYNRTVTQYNDAKVHEAVMTDGLNVVDLKAPLLHVPFRTTAQFLAKMQHYSTLYSEQHRNKRTATFAKAFWHSLYAFFRSYFFQWGWCLGKEGFIISLYNSNTVFYKYIKLWEENLDNKKKRDPVI